MNRYTPEKMDTKEYGNMIKLILIPERVPAKNTRGWTIERQRSVIRKECKRLREEFEVGGFMAQKALCKFASKRMLEDRGPCPEKTETCSVNSEPCTRKTFSAFGWKEDVGGKEEKRERMNKETNEEESRKREVEGERERVAFNSQRICLDRLSTKVFEVLSAVSEVDRVGIFLGFPLCLPASPPVVPVVTVPFSGVDVDCEVVFCDSDCEFVEPQTFSSAKTRSKCGFGF